MNYNDNVAVLSSFGIELKECDIKSVRYSFSFTDPELLKHNLELISELVDKLDHVSNHSLLMIVCDDFLESKVDFLKEHDIPITPRSIWSAHKHGYKKPLSLENQKGVVKAA